MHSFVRNLITEWRRLELPFAGETVVVAVSGGADSVSLLLAAHDLVKRKKLGHRIVAAHFNHGLRGVESDDDEKFVRGLATDLGVELAVGRGRLSPPGNLEQNARVARYDFLGATAENLKAFAVLTGHSINDQAETFLMNLIRGSGPDGLAGMRSVRVLEKENILEEEKRRKGEEETKTESETRGRRDAESNRQTISYDNPSPSLPFSPSPLLNSPLLIRPLLTWAKRIDTEAFCRDLGIEYRYDTMNEDTAFKRVRIRKILLPLLEDFNPKIVETLANTASLMQNLRNERESANHSRVAGDLILSEIRELSISDLYDIIRSWLRHHRGTTRQLQLKHIEAIARLILSSKSGKTAELPGGRVVKTGGKLVYDKNKVEN